HHYDVIRSLEKCSILNKNIAVEGKGLYIEHASKLIEIKALSTEKKSYHGNSDN
ncbi:unnamed protein product, partial [Rotaria sp. Silwood2]